MKGILIAIGIIVLIGFSLDWVQTERKEQLQKKREKPRERRYIAGNLDRGKTGAAIMTLQDYQKAFTMFVLGRNRKPNSLQELIDENYLVWGADIDPYGQKYELVYEGKEAVISSPGPDKVRGTPDDIIKRIRVE